MRKLDRTEIEIAHTSVNENGYYLLKKVITSDYCSECVKLLNQDYNLYSSFYAGSKTNSYLSDKSMEKVVYNLHNKNLFWFDIFEHQLVYDIIGKFLSSGSYNNSEPFYLNNISARTPLKGNTGQQLHVDSNLPGINYPIIVNALWYFEDSNKDNGATKIVPNTHNLKKFAEDGKS